MKPQAITFGLGLNEPPTRYTFVPLPTSTRRGTIAVFLIMLPTRATCSAVIDAVSVGLNESEPTLMLPALNMVPAVVASDRKLTSPLTSQTPDSNATCV